MLQPYQRHASQPPRSNQQQIQVIENNLNYLQNRQSNQLARNNNQFNMFSQFDQMANQMMGHMDQQLANLGFHHPFRGFDDIEDQMMEFSNIHRQMQSLNQRDVDQHARDGAFQIYSQSYVSSQKRGPDGRMIQENYFDKNAVARGTNGHTVSERQQGYKNSSGIDRFAHERMLDEKGRKFVKERDHTGQVQTTNHYLNMDDDQVEQFENEWLGMGRNMLQGSSQQFQQQQQQVLPSRERDLNNRAFPRPQLQQYQSPQAPRRSDIQPIMLGGNRNMPPNALPMPNNQRAQQAVYQQPGIQARQPVQQGYGNRQVPNRNQELTGVYQNKGPRNQIPKAG